MGPPLEHQLRLGSIPLMEQRIFLIRFSACDVGPFKKKTPFGVQYISLKENVL